jgi:hypothetical protein
MLLHEGVFKAFLAEEDTCSIFKESPTMDHSPPRFSPGRVLTTSGALETLERYRVDPLALLQRHVSGDWREACPEDAEANEVALRHSLRLVSVYKLIPPEDASGNMGSATIWVITEADRSATTFLLPEEY